METSAEIWQQVHKGLRAFILRRVRNEAEADDILQDVFLRVHRHLERLQDPDRLVSWVFQITRHAIIDHYRALERRHESPVGLVADMEIPSPSSDSKATMSDEMRMELSGCLRPMVERLSVQYREAIKLVEFEGLTHKEAAMKIGISVPGMKSRVQRGRHQLKKLLDDCCVIELDSRRGVAGYERREKSSGNSCNR